MVLNADCNVTEALNYTDDKPAGFRWYKNFSQHVQLDKCGLKHGGCVSKRGSF